MVTQKTKAIAFGSVVLLVLSIAALVFTWGYVNAKGEGLVERATAVANANAREQIYAELTQLVDSTKSDREELSTYILTEEKTIYFLSSIESMAADQQVDLTTNSLNVVEGRGKFDTLVISFSVSGYEEHIYSLLKMFETIPYHGEVSKLSLETLNTDAGKQLAGTIELSVSLLNHDR